MPGLTGAEAIELARTRYGLAGSPGDRAFHVTRIDGQAPYLLVLLETDEGTAVLAAYNEADGSLESAARLPGTNRHLTIDADTAARAAGLPGGQADLVWLPCAASRSPLYPLWRVRRGGNTVFVDHAGNVTGHVTPASPGG